MKPHILFLFSDTGGGHRSAAEAIIESLRLEYKDRLTTQMVDIFKEIAPPPFNMMPEWYPYMMQVPEIYGLSYRLSNGRRRADLITKSAWPYVRHFLRDLADRYPCDLVVSLHPVATDTYLRALGLDRPPFVVVVTDLVSVHSMWYHPQVDLCFVPTEEAQQKALENEMSPEQVKLVGLPVADRFCQPPGDRLKLRQRFGWPQDRLTVVLVGGAEGMGRLEQTAHALSDACFPVTLVIITGRNRALKVRLESCSWPTPVFIYGFVREMPDFMGAADILVTKAGPGTITEAMNAGLPMILYSRLPGQEDGNVSYVVSNKMGVWAPKPELIVEALENWVNHPEQRLAASEACRRMARPQAAREIAHILAAKVGLTDETSALPG